MRTSNDKPRLTFFARIFLSFWSAVILIVISSIFFSSWVYVKRQHALDNVDVAPLIKAARLAAENNGVEGLRAWRRDSELRYRSLDIFLIDKNLEDIDGRAISLRMTEMIRFFRTVPYENPEQNIDGRWGWWDLPEIRLVDGSLYTLAFEPFDFSRLDVLAKSSTPYFLLLTCIVIGTIVCWMLARNMARPVHHMQEVVQKMVEGDLSSGIGEKYQSRTDELGVLARDFDRMANRIRRLLSVKEELLRHVSHEFRSPLARLDLALELARRKNASLDTQLDRIGHESARLDALIGEVLELSKMSDQAFLQKIEVDLIALLAQVVDDANFEGTQYNVRVCLHYQNPAFINGDKAALMRVFDNILRNAITFTASGSVIDVTVSPDAYGYSNLAHWRIDIADFGPGVASKDLPRLFEPFSGISNNVKRDSFGLGLALANNIVVAHHGQLIAENRRDDKLTGLIVSVLLPALSI